MATLLESMGLFTDILNFFLPFLLVFAVMYALLQKSKVLSDSMNVNAIIAFAIGLIVALSGAGRFIARLTPFLTVLFVIVFLIFLTFLFLGAETKWFFNTKGPSMTIIVVALIFVFYVFGTLYGSSFNSLGSEDVQGVTVVEGGDNGKTTETTTVSKANIPGPETCDFATMTGNNAMSCIIGHPKVLGTIVLLGLLALATYFVVYVPKDA
jgi:hypothetical protein